MNKFLIRFSSVVLAVTLAVFALSSCNKIVYEDYKKVVAADGSGDAGWHIRAVTSGGERYEQKVGFSVTRDGKTVKDVFVRFGSLDKGVNEVTIKFTRYSVNLNPSSLTEPHSRTVTASDVKLAKKSYGGWIKINSESIAASSYSNLMLVTSGGCSLKEVAFVSEDGEFLTAKTDMADFWYKSTSTGKLAGTNAVSVSETNKIEDSEDGLPSALTDGQDGVKKSEFWKNMPDYEKSETAGGWKIRTLKKNDETYEHKAVFKLSREGKTVKDVWIKVSSFVGGGTTPVKVVKVGTSGFNVNGAFGITREIGAKSVSAATNGWIRLNDESVGGTGDNYMISTLGGFTLDEVAFVADDDTFIESELARASFRYVTLDGNEREPQDTSAIGIKNVINSADGLPVSACDEQEKTKKSEFWKTAKVPEKTYGSFTARKFAADSGDGYFIHKLGFKLSSATLSDVWIKISAFDVGTESAEISFNRLSSENSLNVSSGAQESEKFTATVTKDGLTAKDGWIKLNAAAINSDGYCFGLFTEGGFTIEEVAFSDADGQLIEATFTRCNVKYTTVDGKAEKTNEISAYSVSNIINSADGLPTYLCDDRARAAESLKS